MSLSGGDGERRTILTPLFLLWLPILKGFLTTSTTINKEYLSLHMSRMLTALSRTCTTVVGICLPTAIANKVALNARKYPADLCKGEMKKYTAYSSQTGIDQDRGQETREHLQNSVGDEEEDWVDHWTVRIREFATAREWHQYHNHPRNLVLALQGELGELSACGGAKDKDHWSQELADVSIYLLRLADVCGIPIRLVVENDDEPVSLPPLWNMPAQDGSLACFRSGLMVVFQKLVLCLEQQASFSQVQRDVRALASACGLQAPTRVAKTDVFECLEALGEVCDKVQWLFDAPNTKIPTKVYPLVQELYDRVSSL